MAKLEETMGNVIKNSTTISKLVAQRKEPEAPAPASPPVDPILENSKEGIEDLGMPVLAIVKDAEEEPELAGKPPRAPAGRMFNIASTVAAAKRFSLSRKSTAKSKSGGSERPSANVSDRVATTTTEEKKINYSMDHFQVPDNPWEQTSPKRASNPPPYQQRTSEVDFVAQSYERDDGSEVGAPENDHLMNQLDETMESVTKNTQNIMYINASKIAADRRSRLEDKPTKSPTKELSPGVRLAHLNSNVVSKRIYEFDSPSLPWVPNLLIIYPTDILFSVYSSDLNMYTTLTSDFALPLSR
jgi:hypothetical protein